LIPVFAWIFALLALGVSVGIAYQFLGTRRDRNAHPPPGRMIDLGTHRLHLYETGSGSPTILFEAGLMSTMLSFRDLQRELSSSFRVVCYDRAGLGWSELGPMPRTAERIVDELHLALGNAGIPPPYILVGHSFGGLTMPLFAARFPNEVAGVVLIDAVAPAEWDPPSEQDARNARIGAKVCRRAAVLARIGVIRLVASLLTSPLKNMAGALVRLISRGTPANAGSVSSPWFFALPPEERSMAAVFWVQPKFAMTIASQLENLPTSAKQVAPFDRFCAKKVVILTAHSASARRRNAHSTMARQLPFAEHILVSDSNHWIMQHNRNLVMDTIRKLAENQEQFANRESAEPAARAGSSVRSS
jgi:pimeloyl-ACP methyl ester carboxylesterase